MEYVFIYIMIGILISFGILAYVHHERDRDVTVSDVLAATGWVFIWPFMIVVILNDINEKIGDKVLLKSNKKESRWDD